jgi:hypothetical protein
MMEEVTVMGETKKEEKPDPASARIRIPKGCDCKVEGFSTCQVEQSATITLVGKVVELEASSKRWNNGRSLEIEPSSITIKGPAEKAMGIEEALKKAGVKL